VAQPGTIGLYRIYTGVISSSSPKFHLSPPPRRSFNSLGRPRLPPAPCARLNLAHAASSPVPCARLDPGAHDGALIFRGRPRPRPQLRRMWPCRRPRLDPASLALVLVSPACTAVPSSSSLATGLTIILGSGMRGLALVLSPRRVWPRPRPHPRSGRPRPCPRPLSSPHTAPSSSSPTAGVTLVLGSGVRSLALPLVFGRP
jgi:hypothetical protein